jgi:hypothetical protein
MYVKTNIQLYENNYIKKITYFRKIKIFNIHNILIFKSNSTFCIYKNLY